MKVPFRSFVSKIKTSAMEFFHRFFVVRKVRELAESYYAKSPLQKWTLFKNITGFLLKFSGINILDPQFTFTLLSTSGIIMGVDYLSSIAYAAYYHRNSPFTAIQGFCWIGAVILVSSGNIFFIHLMEKINRNFSFRRLWLSIRCSFDPRRGSVFKVCSISPVNAFTKTTRQQKNTLKSVRIV